MKKRILSILMIVCMFAGVSPVHAISEYTKGELTYQIDLSDWKTVENGSREENPGYENGWIRFGENGKVVYEDFLRINAESITIISSFLEDTTIEVTVNGEKFSKDCIVPMVGTTSPDRSEKLTFTFDRVAYIGDVDIEIKTSKPWILKSITFNREKRPSSNQWDSITDRPLTAFSDYEDALLTSVVINYNSPIIKVGNALRYINYDDVTETPLLENNTLYMPVKAYANAVGYYCEEYADKDWVLLRSYDDKVEFVLKNGALYLQKDLGAYEQIDNLLIKRNGKYYVPVRYFSEILGKTVKAKDGYVVIDERDLVRKAMEEPIFSQIKEEFSGYIRNSVQGNTYHVAQSENASDDNDGSEARPFLTLNKAGSVAKAGDTVIVHNGTYRETFAPQNDGTGANPIVFRAADGESPVISALEKVTAAPETDGDMLVYDVGIDLGDGRNLVFYEGEAIREARHPNTNNSKHKYAEALNLGPLWQTEGDILMGGADRSLTGFYAGSETSLDQEEEDYWKGGTYVGFAGFAYNQQMAKILHSEKGVLELSNEQLEMFNTDRYEETDWGYITNHIHAVDMPGEWYMSGGKLWIIPPEGTTAETLSLEVKARQLAVDLKDRQYIQLENINVLGGGVRMNDSKLCVLNGGSYRYISHYTMSVDQHYGFITTGHMYDKDGEPMRGEMGIYMGGDSCAIINTHIQWSAAASIYITGKYSYIENNLIEDTGYMGSYCSGIQEMFADTDDITDQRGGTFLINNTLRRSGRSLIDFQNGQYNWNAYFGFTPYIGGTIAFNEISDGSITARDTGTIYMWVTQMGSDRRPHGLHHNLSHDSWCSDGNNMGIYYDNYVQQAQCWGNVIFSSNEEIMTNYGPVYAQTRGHFAEATSVIDRWNNSYIPYLEGGKDSLTVNDYPSGKYFTSGYNQTGEQDLTNYNLFDPDSGKCRMSDTSKGVDVVDNTAWFTGEDQWVKFENVEFDETTNALKIFYKSKHRNDALTYDNNKIDSIQVVIGNSRSGGLKKYMRLFAEAPTDSEYNTVTVPVYGLSGSQSVWVESVDSTDTGISYVLPVRDGCFDEYDDFTARIYGGTFTQILSEGTRMNKKTMGDGRGETMGINNLWGDMSVVRYDNVKIGEEVDVLTISGGSGEIYLGAEISVCIDDPDSDPIGSAIITEKKDEKYSWDADNPVDVYLKEPLKPGTYTMYLKASGTNKVTDFWYFGFKNSKKNKLINNGIQEVATNE